MELIYTLQYHDEVIKDDIPALNGAWKKRIKAMIEQKLTINPTLYGKSLRKDLHGFFKLRVGDYRVIYQIKNTEVFIFVIQHRREVYKNQRLTN